MKFFFSRYFGKIACYQCAEGKDLDCGGGTVFSGWQQGMLQGERSRQENLGSLESRCECSVLVGRAVAPVALPLPVFHLTSCR